MACDMNATDLNGTEIAIVGMAAHLPGARTVAEYWANLRDGKRAIRRLSEAEAARDKAAVSAEQEISAAVSAAEVAASREEV